MPSGNSVSQVARRRGISASHLFGWRRKAILITDRRLEESTAKALWAGRLPVLQEAQMGYLLEGIDWRAPQKTWRPELAG
jgi:transposase-like protein